MTTDRTKQPVTVTVDAAQSRGTLKRIWRSIGYDELNWTYTPLGKRIFEEIGGLNDGPFWIRNHNIFSSGNLRSSPYEASTNCYSEDADGNAVYDWTTVDRIYDIYVANGCKPMIELDFMPHDLSRCPKQKPYESGRFPPKDYDKWRELNRRFAQHLIDRYGLDEVRTWYFSSWNEPDLTIWIDIPREAGRDEDAHQAARTEEFLKIHDYAIDGILAADDRLRVGGPDSAWADSGMLETFLEHCDSGTNYATGGTGSRLDFISFHAKGTGKRGGKVLPPDFDQIARRDLLKGVSVIREFPRYRDLPLLLNEWDIDVWSPGGIHDLPGFSFRNTSYFPVFLIRTVKEMLDLCDREEINVELITQWTFYFHGFRCFEGTRSLVDPMGIRKPLFNGFELLARLGDERLPVTTDDTAKDIAPGQEAGMSCRRRPRDAADAEALGPEMCIQPYPQIDGMATRDSGGIQVLVWNQIVDVESISPRRVRIKVDGLDGYNSVRVTEYRVGPRHSNAHTIWQQLGCPDYPDEEQIAAMRERERLEAIRTDVPIPVRNGVLELETTLPTHAASLFTVV